MPNSLYPATSPYFNSKIENNSFLDVLKYRPIPRDSSDVYFTITQVYEFRPDLLAFDLYGDANLWWVFAERNPNTLSKDPYFDLKAGTKIYIPQLSTLQQVLGI